MNGQKKYAVIYVKVLLKDDNVLGLLLGTEAGSEDKVVLQIDDDELLVIQLIVNTNNTLCYDEGKFYVTSNGILDSQGVGVSCN